MKNKNEWLPSKYVFSGERLIASRDQREVGIGSRLITDVIAKHYQENLKLYAKGKLLDLGCGKAPLYHVYKDYVSDNICVDWGNSIHENPCLDFECDLTQSLPFEDNEFDTIILSDVLEHIPEPLILWKEMNRVLVKGGRLIMNVPFFYLIHEEPHDYYRYTQFALRYHAEQSEFRVLLLKPIGGAPEIVTDIFSKCVLRIPRVGKSISNLSQWITLKLLSTVLGSRISSATSDSFPFGYFLVSEKK